MKIENFVLRLTLSLRLHMSFQNLVDFYRGLLLESNLKKLILVHFLHFWFRLTPTKMIVSCRALILSQKLLLVMSLLFKMFFYFILKGFLLLYDLRYFYRFVTIRKILQLLFLKHNRAENICYLFTKSRRENNSVVFKRLKAEINKFLEGLNNLNFKSR